MKWWEQEGAGDLKRPTSFQAVRPSTMPRKHMRLPILYKQSQSSRWCLTSYVDYENAVREARCRGGCGGSRICSAECYSQKYAGEQVSAGTRHPLSRQATKLVNSVGRKEAFHKTCLCKSRFNRNDVQQ